MSITRDLHYLCKSRVSALCKNVGYITDNIAAAKFNMIGVNFQSVDGSGIQLDSITGTGLHGSTDPEAADQIRIWDATTGTYENWYYYVDESDHSWDGWWDYLTQTEMFVDVHPEGLANGSSVWFLSANESMGGAATIAGAVDPALTVTMTLYKGKFNQIANPYPVGLALDDAAQVDWSNAFGSTDPESADQIRIWDAATGTYENWYYYVDESDHSYDGWWDYLTQTQMFEEVHPNGLAAGVPVWYLSNATGSGTFDVTFKTPMAK